MTRLLAAALAFALFATTVQAQTAEEFFKTHKQLTMIVSSAAGGGSTDSGRAVRSRHAVSARSISVR